MTPATESYAAPIVRSIFPPDLPLAFFWTRERCTWRRNLETQQEYWLKNLRKVKRLGYDLDRVLMVDDEDHKLERNSGNPNAVAENGQEPKSRSFAVSGGTASLSPTAR